MIKNYYIGSPFRIAPIEMYLPDIRYLDDYSHILNEIAQKLVFKVYTNQSDRKWYDIDTRIRIALT